MTSLNYSLPPDLGRAVEENLRERGRRALRIHLGAGLAKLASALRRALG